MEIQHPYDCIFFPGPCGSIGRGAVWCDDKSKCAVCGWNPRVSEKRMEKYKEVHNSVSGYDLLQDVANIAKGFL